MSCPSRDIAYSATAQRRRVWKPAGFRCFVSRLSGGRRTLNEKEAQNARIMHSFKSGYGMSGCLPFRALLCVCVRLNALLPDELSTSDRLVGQFAEKGACLLVKED